MDPSLTMIRHSWDIAGSINHTKSSTSSADLPPRPSLSHLRVCRFFFHTPEHHEPSSSNNSRIGRDIFFPPPFPPFTPFCPGDSPGSIHHRHPRARTEGGKNSKEEEKRATNSVARVEPRWSGVVTASPASCPLCRLSINHRRKQRNNVSWSIEKVVICIDRYFDFAIVVIIYYRGNVILIEEWKENFKIDLFGVKKYFWGFGW